VTHFTWISWISPSWLPDHTATALLVTIGILWWARVALRQLETAADAVVPDGTLTARNALEILVERLIGIAESVIGSKGRKYVPLYGSFFIFILVSNLLGLLPGFSPPTSNFNVTFALGLTSFVMYNYYGFQEHGAGYLKHFVGPIPLLAVLMVPLELIDNCVRPLTLGLRLAANMTADHLVLGIFTDLTKLVVPVIFYMLGAFVSLIQTFVFTLLSLVYVSLAVAGHGDHEEHAHH
jgi:F-type H+-transporting ATPase subunit a